MPPPIVIYYHQLVSVPRPGHALFGGAVTPEEFRAGMVYLKERHHPLRMEEFLHGWDRGRRWPRRAVLVTFDDGYKNSLWAAQILNSLDMSATFFVLSDATDSGLIPADVRFLDLLASREGDVFDTRFGHVDFLDARSRNPWYMKIKELLFNLPPPERETFLKDLMADLRAKPFDPRDANYQFLGSADLRQMVELGMTIGSHGATHEKLTRCTDLELEYELADSRAKLQAITGRPVDTFAYPFGRFDSRVRESTAKHYRVAFGAIAEHSTRDRCGYPRRRAAQDVRPALSPWLPAKQSLIRVARRLLMRPAIRWDN